MTVIALSHLSPGAPALNGINGALCNVLDWALPQAGWAIEYSASNKRVYRAGTGRRRRLRVAHDSAVSGLAQLATVRAAASAIDVDTLVDPFPTVSQLPDTTSVWCASTVASATAASYYIYLSDTWFWLFTDQTSGTNWHAYFFGDVPASLATDTGNTVLCVRGSSSASATTASLWTLGSTGTTNAGVSSALWYWAESIDGLIKSARGAAQTSADGACGLNSNLATARAGYANAIAREKIALFCGGSTTSTNSAFAMMRRGWLPNVWCPLHNGKGSLVVDDTHRDSAYNADAIFRPFPYGSTTSSGFVIAEETDTWSPPNG